MPVGFIIDPGLNTGALVALKLNHNALCRWGMGDWDRVHSSAEVNCSRWNEMYLRISKGIPFGQSLAGIAPELRFDCLVFLVRYVDLDLPADLFGFLCPAHFEENFILI